MTPDQTPEDVDVAETPGELIEQHPLVQLFGTHAKARVVAVLLEADQPLNPTRIQERADIHHDTWYRVRDDLLDSGIIVEAGQAGNSPLYAVPDPSDDQRTQWLRSLTDWTSAVHYHDKQPPTPDDGA